MHFTRILGLTLALATRITAQTPTTPDEALLWLKTGNERFVAGKSEGRPLGEGVRRTLAKGQHPLAIVWTCADSRVAPEHIFNAGLGEVFVVRTAGNACDPESLASVEYAAEHLQTPLLVVMGHEKCGAVKAAMDDAQATPAIRRVLERIAPAVRRAKKEGLEGEAFFASSVAENVQETVAQALQRSGTLRELVRLGKFRVVAARYDLESGEVEWLPERPVEPEPKNHGAHKKPPVALPPHTALSMLQAGHRRYVAGAGGHPDLTAARRELLGAGQHPMAIVVTCADSRVAPEHVFDAGLGDIFVIRVAGNVLNDSVQASVEYAAEHLGASLVLWMGHDSCGAVKAALGSDGHGKVSESMRRLLEKLEPAVERARRRAGKDDLLPTAIEENVRRSVQELRKNSAVIRELEEEGRLGILPVVYRLESGDVSWLDEATNRRTKTAAHAGEPEAHPAPAGETDGHAKPADEPASHGASVHEKHPASEDAHEPAAEGAKTDAHAAGHDAEHGAAHAPAYPPTHGHGATRADSHSAAHAPARTPVSPKKQGFPYGTLGIGLLAATLGIVVIWTLQARRKPA